ncbi:MAG: SEC-C metal-binding domain-containing protein [bacterium]
MSSETGRNDPCPCGSGRKYKKCCLLKEEATRPLTKQLLREASAKAASLLMDFALKYPEPVKRPLLNRPVPELPDEEAQSALSNNLLTPWVLYLWCPPDDSEQILPSERTAVARFLRKEGSNLDGITRRFIEAARSEPFTYWQVQSVSPGESLLLQDMATGEERVVLDAASSSMASQWDIFFAQVVGLDGVNILNGMGLYPLPPFRFRQSVDTFISEIKPAGGSIDRHGLLRRQGDLIHHYLKCIDDLLHPTLPELRNTDGDKLVFATSRYTFDAQYRQDVITALSTMCELEAEAEGKENGTAKFVWVAMPKSRSHKGKVAKATLSVGPDWLESECNSEKRDKTLSNRLLKQMGSLITHESTNLKPFHPNMAPAASSDSEDDKSGLLDLFWGAWSIHSKCLDINRLC